MGLFYRFLTNRRDLWRTELARSGKCPTCGIVINSAAVIKIETDTHGTTLFGPLPEYGFAYVCPNPKCGVLLPIWPVMQAKHKT